MASTTPAAVIPTAVIIKRLVGLNGVFAVYKPAGESSSQTVERIKKLILSNLPYLKSKREHMGIVKKVKVGHGGTLDPIATGVLVIGLGEGCKQLGDYLRGTKRYTGTGRFGAAYDTYDKTGVVTEEKEPSEEVGREQCARGLERFRGEIMQRPPPFSAVHVDGVRAYEISRKRQKRMIDNAATDPAPDEAKQDEVLELPERKVTVSAIELVDWNPPEFKIEVECGGGTYIRSIIHDLGRALGSAAAMFELERTRQSVFGLSDCLQVEECKDLDKLEAALTAALEKKML